MDYGAAYEVQQRVHDEVLSLRESKSPTDSPGRILLVEHDPPVITVSQRKGSRQNLVATEAMLARLGVRVEETDRGGDITYHGPGQLVVYPIVDLNAFGLRLHDYMRLLEESVIDALAAFGVKGGRDAGATGVWVNGAKICAMGVRVRRWVSMHGLALNVTTNLDHFKLIVPCGLTGRPVTSLQELLGSECPALERVRAVLSGALNERLVEAKTRSMVRRSEAGESDSATEDAVSIEP